MKRSFNFAMIPAWNHPKNPKLCSQRPSFSADWASMLPQMNDDQNLSDTTVCSAPVANCRIHVRGVLDSRWQDYIGEFRLTAAGEMEDRATLLAGYVPDQTVLLGVLLYLDRFGLQLLKVEWM